MLCSLAQQPLHFRLELVQFGLNDIPCDITLDRPVAVYELVAEPDYSPPFVDLFHASRINLIKLIKGLANDRKIPMHRVAQFTAGQKLLTALAGNVSENAICGVEDILQKFR